MYFVRTCDDACLFKPHLLEVLLSDRLDLRVTVLLDVLDVLHLAVVVLPHLLHLDGAVLANPIRLEKENKRR